MRRIEYSQEASNYFLDNGKLTFELMVALEGLVFSDGVPTYGDHIALEGGWHVWEVMGHLIGYQLIENRLIVFRVQPL